VGAGLVAGAAYAVWRALAERNRGGLHWEAQPFPGPPLPVPDPVGSDAPAADVTDPADPGEHGPSSDPGPTT